MLVDTYQFGKIEVPVESIYGRKILLVSRRVEAAAISDRKAGLIQAGLVLVRRNGRYAIYASIGSVIRSFYHSIMRYGDRRQGEIHQLGRLRSDTDGFLSVVVARRKIAEEARLTRESLIAGSSAELSGCSNEHKKAARRQLMAAASSTDRLGRLNSPRQGMLLGRARKHIDERSVDIKEIRNLTLPMLIKLVEYNRKRIMVMLEIKDTLWRLLFKSNNIWTASSERSCRRLVSRAKTLTVEPFLTYRDLIIRDMEQGLSDIKADDLRGLRLLAVVIGRVRVGLAHVRLDDIRGHLEMLERENRARHLQPEAFEQLVDAQRVRLMHFIDNIRDVEDPDPGMNRLDRARMLTERAYSILVHSGPLSEAVELLGQAVALL